MQGLLRARGVIAHSHPAKDGPCCPLTHENRDPEKVPRPKVAMQCTGDLHTNVDLSRASPFTSQRGLILRLKASAGVGRAGSEGSPFSWCFQAVLLRLPSALIKADHWPFLPPGIWSRCLSLWKDVGPKENPAVRFHQSPNPQIILCHFALSKCWQALLPRGCLKMSKLFYIYSLLSVCLLKMQPLPELRGNPTQTLLKASHQEPDIL